ncbi:MAG: hypothetical protein K5871_01555 [Lachnospiraceae bacterium]|nr:hypothetical protein [Lachnospiraceae bacterium]
MSGFENKFRKFVVPNLTMWLIIGYAIGYIIQMVNDSFLYYLALDPYKIIHGQIWRLVTWLIIPPNESNILFVILMLWCCYSIGTILERTWGTYKYNLFIFTGVFLTILFSFAYLAFLFLTEGAAVVQAYEDGAYLFSGYVWFAFSTYYINVSIYLVFAMTYPNDVVRLYFLIPIKMKWLGIIDIVYMGYLLIVGGPYTRFAVLAAVFNCLIFYVANIKGIALSPKQIHRHNQFNRSYKQGQNSGYKQTGFQSGGQVQKMARHKCAICGKTDLTDPDMMFRYCSKCNGNYEYCQVHLFQHSHVR